MNTNTAPVPTVTVTVSTNRRKSNVYRQSGSHLLALLADSLIFITGGMNLAFSVGWNLYTQLPSTKQLRFCWPVGVIAGALIATSVVPVIAKQKITLWCTFLGAISGIVFTCAPFNYNAILAARYINGVAVGVTTVSFIVYAGEISAKTNRNFCLWLEQLALSLGMLIQVIYSSQWSSGVQFSANRLHGIFCMIFGLLSLMLAPYVIESPIFHIRRYNDEAALDCLQRLQSSYKLDSNQLLALLEQWKQYVLTNENLGLRESFTQGLGALVRLIPYRSLVAFSFALPLNDAMKVSTYIVMGRTYGWPAIVFIVLRFLGTLCSGYIYDERGRKIPSLVSLLLMAGFTIAIGSVFNEGMENTPMSVVCVLSLFLQYVGGLFVPSSSSCLAEAFPLLVKPYFIAVCVIVEQLVHIIVICTFDYSVNSVFVFSLSAGAIEIVCFVVFMVTIPETISLPLKEAQDHFGRWVHSL